MPTDDEEIIKLLTRGFGGVAAQLQERDERVIKLSETIIRIEGELKAMGGTLTRLEGELARSEGDGLKIRVTNLESLCEKQEKKQDASDTWIRGLLISVIFLLIGLVASFVQSRLK